MEGYLKKMDKFVKKNEFYGYEELLNSGLIRNIYKFTPIMYNLFLNLYKNINDDDFVIELAKKIYELGGFIMLQDSIYVLNSIFEKSKNEYIYTYNRKLEFLYQNVCYEWQA